LNSWLTRIPNPQAQVYLASLYQGGLGVPVDGIKAVEWYGKAAAQQINENRISALANHNLGTIYNTGLPGVVPDSTLAKQYWRRAAELGSDLIPKDWYE
jgi:TPR repeat protein